METNYHTDFYERMWYKLWGCEEHFTQEGERHLKTLDYAKGRRLGFDESQVDWASIEKLINSTERVRQTHHGHHFYKPKSDKPKTQKQMSIKDLMAKLVKLAKEREVRI